MTKHSINCHIAQKWASCDTTELNWTWQSTFYDGLIYTVYGHLFYDQLKKTHITQTKANGDQTENKKQNKHILMDFGVDTSVQRCVVTVTILVYKRYASFALWVGSVS